MTITLSKPIAIVLIICLAIIVVCDITLMILKIYQRRLDRKERELRGEE